MSVGRERKQRNFIQKYNIIADALNLSKMDEKGICEAAVLSYAISAQTSNTSAPGETERDKFISYFEILNDVTIEELKRLLRELTAKITLVSINNIISECNKQKLKLITPAYPKGIPFAEILLFCKTLNDLDKMEKKKLLSLQNQKKTYRFVCPIQHLIGHLKRFNMNDNESILISADFHAFYLEKTSDGYYLFEPNNAREFARNSSLLKTIEEVAAVIVVNFEHYITSNKLVLFSMNQISFQKEKNPAIDEIILASSRLEVEGINALIDFYENKQISTSTFLLELDEKLNQSLEIKPEKSELINTIFSLLTPLAEKEREFLNKTLFVCKDYLNESVFNYGITLAHLAAMHNDLPLLKALHERGINIDKKETRCGCTPLFDAIQNNNVEMVEFLWENHADVNAVDIEGCSPLFRAVQLGYEKVVQVLIDDQDIKINLANNEGITPLLLAFLRNSSESIIKLLLMEDEININTKSNDGFTPLYCTIINNRPDFLDLLINHNTKLKFDEASLSLKQVFEIIAKTNYVSNVRSTMLTSNAFANYTTVPMLMNQPSVAPIHLAILLNRPEMVKKLISAGADLNKRLIGIETIDLAKAVGNQEIIALVSMASKKLLNQSNAPQSQTMKSKSS